MARMDENIRQRTDTLRTVAALANVGRSSQALRVLGDSVVENDQPAEHAAALWLGLSAEDRAATAVFASGRDTRRTISNSIQAGLVAEGTLRTDNAIEVTVHQSVSRTREEMRYADSYKPGQSLRVSGQVPELGLRRGMYEVTRVFANGKVEIDDGGRRTRFDPQKIDPSIKLDRLALTTAERVTLHEGDHIRWTTNDKDRGMLNSATARVLAIDGRGVTVELASRDQVTLAPGDPMLSRLDLAYSLNMHMAQGITTDRAITVMLSYERNLSNQRLFNVGVTRVRDDVTMVVDNQEKLERQLDRNPGDKTSALESLGRIEVDGPAARTNATDDALTAALAVLDADGREPIIVTDLPGPGDLPPMGRSDTDYSKSDGLDDPIHDQLSARRDEDGDRCAAKEDKLGIHLPDRDELRGIPLVPGSMERSPGLPEKNLSLDL